MLYYPSPHSKNFIQFYCWEISSFVLPKLLIKGALYRPSVTTLASFLKEIIHVYCWENIRRICSWKRNCPNHSPYFGFLSPVLGIFSKKYWFRNHKQTFLITHHEHHNHVQTNLLCLRFCISKKILTTFFRNPLNVRTCNYSFIERDRLI